MKIVIIDLGVSNINSLTSALNYLGIKKNIHISNLEDDITNCTHLIIPGVGSFDYAMNKIISLKLLKIINKVKNTDIKILGICLGMQLMLSSSKEGKIKGLGLIKKKCDLLKSSKLNNFKTPNVGFKKISVKKKINNLFDNLDNSYFYFTHSYALFDNENLDQFSTTVHNKDFISSFSVKNFYACQFHPEKSQTSGLIFFKNFFLIR